MFEGAAEVDFVGSAFAEALAEKSADVGGEGVGFPDGGRTQEAGEDFSFGGMEGSDAGGFFSCIFQPLFGDGGFDFEDGVDGLDGDVDSGGVGEEWWGEDVVVDGVVDLAGAAAGGIDDEGGGCSVALGEVVGEEFDPEVFGGGAVGGGVFEDATDGEIG